MAKAFRCDVCKKLIEDEVDALYPNLLAGYGAKHSVKIEVHRTDSGNSDTCEACVANIAALFLANRRPNTGKAT